VDRSSWDIINHLIRTLPLERKATYIIGLGGGKVIDVAKMVAYKLNKHFISIPTAPSHDGIASQFVSIRSLSRAYSYLAKPPLAIIIDIDVVSSAPKRLVASGVGDALAKFTAVKDWYLSKIRTGEYYGDYSANLALLGARMVSKHAGGIGRGFKESIRVLVEALISDGVAAGIAGSSRPCSGSEHLFSHALDIYSSQHALHGEQCGVGAIIMMYLHGGNYNRIKRALKKAGAPTNSNELGIDEKNIIKALVMARNVRPERYTILSEVKMDEKMAKEVAMETGVI
jgi:glycerol-1-phosphate dehydrogenase [NAD(P)+]